MQQPFNIGDEVQRTDSNAYGERGRVVEVNQEGRTRVYWTHWASGNERNDKRRTWIRAEALTKAGNVTQVMIEAAHKASEDRWKRKYGHLI